MLYILYFSCTQDRDIMEVYSVTSLPALASSSVPSSSNVPAVIASNESLVGRYCGKKLPGPVVSEVGNSFNCIWQDSLNQCPMPINADQNHGIDLKCRSRPIDIDQNWSKLRGVDWHWSELIDIGIDARILIGIDQHLPLIEGVLIWVRAQCLHMNGQCWSLAPLQTKT